MIDSTSESAAPTDVENVTPALDTQATTPAPETASTTSTETPADSPNALLDAVRAALPKAEGETVTPAVEAKTTEAEPAVDDDSDVAEDDLKDIQNPSVLKRTRRAMRQRDAARHEVQALRPEADNWRSLTTFFEQTGITPDEANKGYRAMALLKAGEYAKFVDEFGSYFRTAQQGTGDILPDDLQTAVSEGRTDPELAREHARARSEAAVLADRARHSAQQQEVATRQRIVADINTATNSLEASWRASDPDYDVKADTVVRFSKALVAERGFPRTADEAVAMAREAKKQADEVFSRARPSAPATRPSASAASNQTNVAAPAPRSALEAARLALQRTG